MTIFLIAVVVVVGSAFWVYLDATKHKIGPTEGEESFDTSPGSWAIDVLILWFVNFPAYIIKRKALIEKAKQSPSEPDNRTWGIVVFSFVGVLAIIVVALFASTGDNLSKYYDNVVDYENVFYDNVTTVKEGNFTACQGYKVGPMIDKYFGSPEWTSFVGNDGNSYVNVSGNLEFNNKPTIAALLQFLVDDQTGSFQIEAFEWDGISQNYLKIQTFFGNLCDSMLILEKLSNKIAFRKIDLLDLKVDYYKLLSKKIIVSGFGQMFGETFILKNYMMDLNLLWIDISNVDREGRRYVISK